MTINKNHQSDFMAFILFMLSLILPMYLPPKSYKIVVNRSKKPFFNYVPVCNLLIIRLIQFTLSNMRYCFFLKKTELLLKNAGEKGVN